MRTIDVREALTRAFCDVLRNWLGEPVLASVAALNAAEPNKSVCHSHDFCDANEAMDEAFKRALGRPADTEDDNDLKLWTDAWNRAKARGFKNPNRSKR